MRELPFHVSKGGQTVKRGLRREVQERVLERLYGGRLHARPLARSDRKRSIRSETNTSDPTTSCARVLSALLALRVAGCWQKGGGVSFCPYGRIVLLVRTLCGGRLLAKRLSATECVWTAFRAGAGWADKAALPGPSPLRAVSRPSPPQPSKDTVSGVRPPHPTNSRRALALGGALALTTS